jgi:hypothetical protein
MDDETLSTLSLKKNLEKNRKKKRKKDLDNTLKEHKIVYCSHDRCERESVLGLVLL